MTFRYLTLEDALQTHAKTVEVSGGGSLRVLNQEQIESVLTFVQNDEYYPTFVDKLTYLFYAMCKNHCFEDGNKRIAVALSAQMLLVNGWLKSLHIFMEDMENISYHVAAGSIDRNLLHEIFDAYLNDNYEENEELKLKIFNAISNTPLPD